MCSCCVTAESVHVAIAGRYAAVREEEAELMDRLGHERREVPERVRILQIRLRVALLSVDEVGELLCSNNGARPGNGAVTR